MACAAQGERNPATLKTAALSAIVECTHLSHDIFSGPQRGLNRPAQHWPPSIAGETARGEAGRATG